MRIDQTNYESFFLSYIDGELSAAEQRAVDAYCEANPGAARELALLQQTVSVPGDTGFAGKESLYREERDRRAIGWYVWRAAAVLVLLAGGGYIYLTMPHNGNASGASGKMAIEKRISDPLNGKESDAGPGPDSATSEGGRKGTQRPEEPDETAAIGERAGITAGRLNKAKDSGSFVSYNGTVQPKKKRSSFLNDRNSPQSSKPDDNESHENKAVEQGLLYSEQPESTSFPIKKTESGLSPVRMSPEMAKGGLQVPVSKSIRGVSAIDPDRLIAGNALATTDRPAYDEAINPNGDDAVSVVHLSGNKESVRKLLRRITSGSQRDGGADNGSDKKVNVSIFQFALGK